jgi:signal transduction histidine kinase
MSLAMLTKLYNKQSHLQQKLTFYPLFWFAIGLLVTFGVTVALIKQYLDNYLLTQITAYSQQTAKDITNIIDHDKEALCAFLLSDTMRDLKDPNRLTVALERLLSQNKNFLEGSVIDLDGQTLVSVSRLRIFSDHKPDFHKNLIFLKAKTGQIGISGWENFIEKNRPFWYMAIPIEKYPGKVNGVLLVTIDLRRIEDAILTSQGAKYGTPILIDHQGNILVHIDRSRLGDNWSKHRIVQKILHGEIGTTNYYDDHGRYVLAAYQPLNPYNWGLIVQVPPGQTIYMIRNKIILLFSLMMIIIFIVTGLFTYAAAGRIVVPIKELTKASHRFGEGEKLEYSPLKGNDEITQLSIAFYEMAVRLQDHEKQRAQYISMIAHDLRNPLTSITEFFHSASEGAPVPDEKLRNLGLTKLEQVNRMIGDLLEFSRLDLGEINFSLETVSVKYLCDEVITGYREKSPKFILADFAANICVWADPIRLQQILQNILDNSLKYTPSGSAVKINCKASHDYLEIIVSDSGPGIPAEVLDKIFTPFQPNFLQKEGSYGLGLAIAKKLALQMNGDLKVESTKGKGSVFRIILPRVNPG